MLWNQLVNVIFSLTSHSSLFYYFDSCLSDIFCPCLWSPFISTYPCFKNPWWFILIFADCCVSLIWFVLIHAFMYVNCLWFCYYWVCSFFLPVHGRNESLTCTIHPFTIKQLCGMHGILKGHAASFSQSHCLQSNTMMSFSPLENVHKAYISNSSHSVVMKPEVWLLVCDSLAVGQSSMKCTYDLLCIIIHVILHTQPQHLFILQFESKPFCNERHGV